MNRKYVSQNKQGFTSPHFTSNPFFRTNGSKFNHKFLHPFNIDKWFVLDQNDLLGDPMKVQPMDLNPTFYSLEELSNSCMTLVNSLGMT